MSGYDWEANNSRTVFDSQQVLERTTASIARSQQVSIKPMTHLCITTQNLLKSNKIAIQTEDTGIEIISELDSQREALLRTSDRLDNVNDGLHDSGKIARLMTRAVLYNKLVLILIILFEALILILLIYYKFIQK